MVKKIKTEVKQEIIPPASPRNIITINAGAIPQMAKEGGKFVFKKEAEAEILKIKKLIFLLEKAEQHIKDMIVATGQSLDPSFKGVVGEYIRATYRRFGEKYTYDKSQEVTLKDFLKSVTWVKVDSKKVDEYVEKTKELPKGIIEKEREPQLSMEVIDKALLEAEI
jgi:hypothetical protein